jgi:hypothetical protein
MQIICELWNCYTYGHFKPKITVQGEWVTISMSFQYIIAVAFQKQ